METIAKHRHARSSAQKVRLVADLIRGKKVSQALDILTYTNKESGCTGQESSGICHRC